MKFSLENVNKVENIKAGLDKIKSEIFRYLITKTTADDEATNKFVSVKEEENEVDESVVEIKEEIEKSEDLGVDDLEAEKTETEVIVENSVEEEIKE